MQIQYLHFYKKSQNWCKAMRLRHHIKSASFLDKKRWEICHVDGMTSKIHMYYGGAHVNATMRGCKHAAPTIRTKSIVHRFASAVVVVNEFCSPKFASIVTNELILFATRMEK